VPSHAETSRLLHPDTKFIPDKNQASHLAESNQDSTLAEGASDEKQFANTL